MTEQHQDELLQQQVPQEFPDTEAILAEYQHRKMVESLMGPIISLLAHIVMMVCLVVFYDAEASRPAQVVELEMKEMEVKELDTKMLEELETLETIAQDLVPTVEKPTVFVDDAIDVASVADFSDAMASTDDGLDFSDVLDIRANDSPLKLSSLYGGRTNEGRKKTMQKFGGNEVTEAAVLRALRWLKKTQNPNGSWAPSQQHAMAGLALLTFLAHGETPLSEEFGETVQRAMQYLTEYMDNLKTKNPEAYGNGIVAYALSEAYGLTKVPSLKPAMEKALQILVDGQQTSGGYDYNYKKGARWDLSVACWNYQAMKAGYVAGADVDGLEKAMEKGINFMRNVSFSKTNNKFGYASPGSGSDYLQGAGTLCLQLLGDGRCYEAKMGIKYIREKCKVVWNDPKRKVQSASGNPLYGWYYQTQAMFHEGKNTWKEWNSMFAPELIKYQHRDGYWECPSQVEGKFNCNYDKWYTTTLAALSLQVYYRYLPTYKMPKSIVKTEKTMMEKLDDDLGLDL